MKTDICRWILTLAALGALAADSGYGQGCKAYDVSKPGDEVLFDMRTGRVHGRLKRGADEQVTVCVINKNPFARTYSVAIKETAMGEPALQVFLPLLGGIVSEVGSLQQEVRKATPAPPPPPQQPDLRTHAAPCPKDVVKRIADDKALLERLLKSLSKKNSDVKGQRRSFQEEFSKATGAYSTAREVLLDMKQSGEALDKAAGQFALVSIPSTASLNEGIEAMHGLAAAIGQVATELSGFLVGKDECEALAHQILTEAELTSSMALEYSKSLSAFVVEASKQLATVKTEQARVERIRGDPKRYTKDYPVGPYDNATSAEFEVSAKDSVGNEVQKLKAVLTFGAPYISLTGGMVYSGLDSPKYLRVSSAATAKDGTVSIQPIVGRQDGSTFRFLPMVMLNARLADWKVPIYATLGATAHADSKGTSPEYLVGLSGSFLKNLMYLTAGVYIGRQEALEGGFKLGDSVPEKLDPIPTRKDLKKAFGFAISYRFK